jgi:hypothetical protein
MKTLTKFALAAMMLITTLTAQAGGRGTGYHHSSSYAAPSYRSSSSSGYVYRNPYAASPSVSVGGYYRSSGTYVAPYVRTAPNSTVTDNLSYRGYGTTRVPKSSYGW